MGDLKENLSLEQAQYEKNFADWEDVKIAIRYSILDDPHCYHDNRLQVQLILIFLLVAEDGGRLGAIVRSSSYRESEVALRYKVGRLFNNSETKLTDKRILTSGRENVRKGERRSTS